MIYARLQPFLRQQLSLVNGGDLLNFQRFIRLLASRCDQILNYSGFANALVVSVNTIKRWLWTLQESQIVYPPEPYHSHAGKTTDKKCQKLFFRHRTG